MSLGHAVERSRVVIVPCMFRVVVVVLLVMFVEPKPELSLLPVITYTNKISYVLSNTVSVQSYTYCKTVLNFIYTLQLNS